MSCFRQILARSGKILTSFFILLSVNVSAQEGEQIYKSKCISCHKVDKNDGIGPALQGSRGRVEEGTGSKDAVYKWINNPNAFANDKYFGPLIKQRGSVMSAVQLSNKEIDAVLKWADEYKPPTPGGGAGVAAAETDNTLLYGLITLILALVGFILLQVNSNLRKLTDEKDGIRRGEPVPFYRNKTYLMTATLILAGIGGYLITTGFGGTKMSGGAVGLGRQQGYQPEQPIYYSHKVHAGTNQISCLYCHGGSEESKHANIPSVNVCMNCHMSVSKYEGEKLVKEDGSPVDGTQEIAKLYKYAGWDPAAKKYNPDNNGDGQPDGASAIPWVKIHNLPDHVYFNHSQHVKVGKQQCQTCHGNIQEMGEVYQFSSLSMGWCVNCHRESRVDFYNPKDGSGNKYYSMFEKFHDRMADSIKDSKSGKMIANPHKSMDSVTVEHIGGTECQKCHY